MRTAVALRQHTVGYLIDSYASCSISTIRSPCIYHAKIWMRTVIGITMSQMLVLGLGLERQVLVKNRRQASDCQSQSYILT